MNLDRTLEQAFRSVLSNGGLQLSAEELMVYAEEDKLGGRDNGEFPDGISPYIDEGRFLYAMVRALKPQNCLEIGCAVGGSASHILLALEKNKSGKLVSIDIDPNSGSMIPDYLRHRWQLIVGEALNVELPKSDFIFEDSDHTFRTTYGIFQEIGWMQPKCVIVHDYVLCEPVKMAFDLAFGDQTTKTLFGEEFMPTGMACWIEKVF